MARTGGREEDQAGVDPRVERSRRRVLEAALEELGQEGYGGFTIESVAGRAGVAKTTIYRHWPHKRALVADVLHSLNRQPPAAPGSPATARARVEQLLRHLAEAVTTGPLAATVAALVEAAERDAEVRRLYDEYSTSRRSALVEAIAGGVAGGELPDHLDPELAALALAGAIFYSRLVTSRPFSANDIPGLVATVLGPPN